MNSNTTLAIIAIVAALGLMTTLLVVEPSIPQAFAQGQSFNKFKAGAGNVPFCTDLGGLLSLCCKAIVTCTNEARVRQAGGREKMYQQSIKQLTNQRLQKEMAIDIMIQ